MGLEVQTLFLVTIYVEAMLGLLLLFAWVQNSAITAVAWWGSAHLLRAASVTLFGLFGSVSNHVSIDLANFVLLTSFAATWVGARVFDGRAVSIVGLLAGGLLWVVLCRVPVIAESMEARVLLSSGIITTYTWLAAFEFWRGRAEPLVSRWPAIFLLFAHGALFLLRTPLSTIVPWAAQTQVFESVWMTVLSFEALLFTIAIAFILLAMAKERTEYLHRTAALIDPLTGIPNRRAFLEGCNHLAERLDRDPRPVAVLVMDLDHFKWVNDQYGHATGDCVLQMFAEAASASVSQLDIVGRLGGEEFAALLHDADRERAIAVAEDIRGSFADAAHTVNGRPIGASVSIGVALCEPGQFDAHALLAQADQALYRAKERGRNRVEIASRDLVLRLDSSTPSLRIEGLAASTAI
jgi:diguanylate cyclase (GGDEF)-like protein